MPAFLYRAVDASGKASKGVLEASSDIEARNALRARNLFPLSLEQTKARAGGADRAGERASPVFARLRAGLQNPMPVKSLALVTRQLATLIGSDIRIEDALVTVARQMRAARAGAILYDIRAAILDGRSFASALGEHPAAFPEYYRASVAAGEHSGRLDAVLAHLADFVESRQKVRRKVQLALLYPALLAVVSLLMIVLLLTFVVPDITRVFVERGADLPWLTRGMIGLSELVANWGIWFLAAFATTGFLVHRWLGVSQNRLRFHRIIATRPPTRSFSVQLSAAQFAGTLSTLLSSGVPLMDALRTAAAVTPNIYIREQIKAATEKVGEGASLGNAVNGMDVFPPMLLAMIASGESSGKLADALSHAAKDQERELEDLVSTLVAMVEPGVLLFMGGIVMLMVLAILLPIIDLNNLAGV